MEQKRISIYDLRLHILSARIKEDNHRRNHPSYIKYRS